MNSFKLIGIGLLSLGGIIITLSFKVKNYNLQFLFTGGVIALIGYLIKTFFEKKVETVLNDEYNTWRTHLVTNGIPIEVDLDKCEIKANAYEEEVTKDYYSPYDKYMALDALIGKDNTEYNRINKSVIIYKTEVYGNERTFHSPVILKDQVSLSFILAN